MIRFTEAPFVLTLRLVIGVGIISHVMLRINAGFPGGVSASVGMYLNVTIFRECGVGGSRLIVCITKQLLMY